MADRTSDRGEQRAVPASSAPGSDAHAAANADAAAAAHARAGFLYALAAFGAWGFFPVYWKLFPGFSSLELLGHRFVWSFAFYAALLTWGRGWPGVGEVWRNRPSRAAALLAGLFICCNWGLYIWAVQIGNILETSLGYFINPLLNVLLGCLVLRERPRPLQWAALAIAAAAVLMLAAQSARVPWIALALAFSFAMYGLIRKRVRGDVLPVSLIESGTLLPVALVVIALHRAAPAAGAELTWASAALLLSTGVATGLPLIWFAGAARRLPLSTLGFFQYLTPSMQFLFAVLLYHEPFGMAQARAFALIWIALAIFSFDLTRAQRGSAREAARRAGESVIEPPTA